jgi:sigma-B regulation protein RsbU (phosphoserine phosphatase)
VPAALIMAAFRASLIAEIRNNFAIKVIMDKVNRLLCESTEPGNYVTAFHSVLDSKNHILTFCNAGHNPPILLRANGKVDWLETGGPVIGVTDLATFEEKAIPIGAGDLIVMYTDGVTEVFDDNEEQFGEERLLELVKKYRALSADELKDKIQEVVTDFASDHHLFDDLTLVIIKRA